VARWTVWSAGQLARLGVPYETGTLTGAPAYGEARRLYCLALRRDGYVGAGVLLSGLYASGLGVARSPRLARRYRAGDGVPRSDLLADFLLYQASEADNRFVIPYVRHFLDAHRDWIVEDEGLAWMLKFKAHGLLTDRSHAGDVTRIFALPPCPAGG
jgi:TPR repeat protein